MKARPKKQDLDSAVSSAPEAETLQAILDAHRLWVETGGNEGARAALSRHNLARRRLADTQLEGADLRAANLKGADLRRANLKGADLVQADLQGAELAGADLTRALLRETNLRDVDLSSADLTGARGLLAPQLGGANLAGTRLPDDLTRFEGLLNVAEASKTTQNLFFSLLFVNAYAWLTIASTRDAQLLNNASPPSSRLPILGTDIPLVQFYLVAPLLLICLFIYFQLCLQRLWEELGDLPAVFPDGRPLDKKAYPWLMNVLARAHAPRLRGQRTNLAWIQTTLSCLLAWGLVPFSLLLLWARYLRAHDWRVTIVHVLFAAFSIGAAIGFYKLASATLRGAARRPFRWRRAWQDARARALLVALVGVGALGMLSFGAIEGHNPTNRVVDYKPASIAEAVDPRFWIPWLLQAAGYNTFAQLDDVNLSNKPPNWTGGDDPAALETVQGADLEGRNIRYAQAFNAFCVNAFLKAADAQGCDFRNADFRGADLRGADLKQANFRYALLQKADLRDADLTDAVLRDTKMAGAKLKEARLERVGMQRAELVEADLTSAILRGADMTDAVLTKAVLHETDLAGAILTNTDLAGADLTGAIGLTRDQLAQAVIDPTTRLPEEFQALARVVATPDGAPDERE